MSRFSLSPVVVVLVPTLHLVLTPHASATESIACGLIDANTDLSAADAWEQQANTTNLAKGLLPPRVITSRAGLSCAASVRSKEPVLHGPEFNITIKGQRPALNRVGHAKDNVFFNYGVMELEPDGPGWIVPIVTEVFTWTIFDPAHDNTVGTMTLRNWFDVSNNPRGAFVSPLIDITPKSATNSCTAPGGCTSTDTLYPAASGRQQRYIRSDHRYGGGRQRLCASRLHGGSECQLRRRPTLRRLLRSRDAG